MELLSDVTRPKIFEKLALLELSACERTIVANCILYRDMIQTIDFLKGEYQASGRLCPSNRVRENFDF